MKCPNCGGEYDKGLLACPYCDAENKEALENYKQDTYDSLNREKQHIKRLPETIKRAASRLTVKVVLLSIPVLIIVVIGVFIMSDAANNKASSENENVENALQELLNNGDYAGMSEYVHKTKAPVYQSRYDKYTQITDIYDVVVKNEEYWDIIVDVKTGNYSSDSREKFISGYVNWILKGSFKIIKESEIVISDRAPLGNEQVIGTFIDEIKISLSEKLGLTDEEYDSLYKMEAYTEDSLNEISEILAGRILKQ